jgi:nucleoside 2-deoxyribosyltransferase
MGKCFLCEQNAEVEEHGPLNQIYQYSCPNCGSFLISSDFRIHFNNKDEGDSLHTLSGYIREMNEIGKRDVLITFKNYRDILASPIIPHTIGAKLEKLLQYCYHLTHYFNDTLNIEIRSNYSLCYAKNADEASALFSQLVDLQYLARENLSGDFRLTLRGIEKAEQFAKTRSQSNTCFVAMWFADEMDLIYENAIRAAIEYKDYYNYLAVQVGKKEHNNDITDEIIAGIRECHFLIADMTGYRGGAYFEAGFAKGLGKQVIFTCRKDWFYGEFDKDNKVIKEKVHFDINHQNIIVWETEEELKKRIIDRIRATIY